MLIRAITLLAVAAVTLAALGGCAKRTHHDSSTVVVTSNDDTSRVGHGPPPHAPAHGYRHKMRDDTALAYDADLGVYVVIGTSGVYYHSERQLYYRMKGSTWEASASLSDGWRRVSDDALPGKLASAQKGRGKGKAKHRVAESNR